MARAELAEATARAEAAQREVGRLEGDVAAAVAAAGEARSRAVGLEQRLMDERVSGGWGGVGREDWGGACATALYALGMPPRPCA